MFESVKDFFFDRMMEASFDKGFEDGEAAATDEFKELAYEEGFAQGYSMDADD